VVPVLGNQSKDPDLWGTLPLSEPQRPGSGQDPMAIVIAITTPNRVEKPAAAIGVRPTGDFS